MRAASAWLPSRSSTNVAELGCPHHVDFMSAVQAALGDFGATWYGGFVQVAGSSAGSPPQLRWAATWRVRCWSRSSSASAFVSACSSVPSPYMKLTWTHSASAWLRRPATPSRSAVGDGAPRVVGDAHHVAGQPDGQAQQHQALQAQRRIVACLFDSLREHTDGPGGNALRSRRPHRAASGRPHAACQAAAWSMIDCRRFVGLLRASRPGSVVRRRAGVAGGLSPPRPMARSISSAAALGAPRAAAASAAGVDGLQGGPRRR